ncbi:LysM [Glarea lozoyensis ATCC 20868]|uniref:LysM n=1 Tax=Glarea lozoyensis (strain ATCC 20868 / MF5171) TaxID=1116229 RepID=S3DCX0_GLAL2|nr:LysM [Glarea lozoyensis ATCC 20868]EPE35580.1 LysM [Glarea lozoyensis ATCC 20868]
MQFQLLSVAAAFLGAAVATPVDLSSSLVARDNCTTYSSVAAGTVCYHTPSDCSETYLVQSGDTCQSIAALYNSFTLTQFYYWNPDIGQTCFGLRAYVPVCISTPWYTFVPPVQADVGTVESAEKIPVPVMPSITSNCTTFELAGNGLRVDAIVQQNGITMDGFLSWNAYIDKTNPVAWDGYWVCVGA